MLQCNNTFSAFVLDDVKYESNVKHIIYPITIETCAIPIAAVEKFLFLSSVWHNGTTAGVSLMKHKIYLLNSIRIILQNVNFTDALI